MAADIWSRLSSSTSIPLAMVSRISSALEVIPSSWSRVSANVLEASLTVSMLPSAQVLMISARSEALSVADRV